MRYHKDHGVKCERAGAFGDKCIRQRAERRHCAATVDATRAALRRSRGSALSVRVANTTDAEDSRVLLHGIKVVTKNVAATDQGQAGRRGCHRHVRAARGGSWIAFLLPGGVLFTVHVFYVLDSTDRRLN